MKAWLGLVAVLLAIGAGVWFHYHGGLTSPGDCPADQIVYNGGC